MMELLKSIDKFNRGLDSLIKGLSWIAYVFMALMILLVVAHVGSRFIFHSPLMGTIELIELMMVIIGFIAIPFAAMRRVHVTMDLITNRLPRKTRIVLGSFAFLLCFAITGVITYQSTLVAIDYAKQMDQGTPLLLIPYAPFRFILAFGFLVLSLKFLMDIFHPLPPEKESKGGEAK
jgi:TRAP-type C4-dicarboxylate transport system permease small subunit